MEKMMRTMALFQTLFWIAITMMFGFSTFVDSAAQYEWHDPFEQRELYELILWFLVSELLFFSVLED
jgi:hypothetical protein